MFYKRLKLIFIGENGFSFALECSHVIVVYFIKSHLQQVYRRARQRTLSRPDDSVTMTSRDDSTLSNIDCDTEAPSSF